jgi:hypothetical protein
VAADNEEQGRAYAVKVCFAAVVMLALWGASQQQQQQHCQAQHHVVTTRDRPLSCPIVHNFVLCTVAMPAC